MPRVPKTRRERARAISLIGGRLLITYDDSSMRSSSSVMEKAWSTYAMDRQRRRKLQAPNFLGKIGSGEVWEEERVQIGRYWRKGTEKAESFFLDWEGFGEVGGEEDDGGRRVSCEVGMDGRLSKDERVKKRWS